MKPGQTLWTREELILALNLYIKTEFGRLHQRNPDVIALAMAIGRTPGSVAYKLVNLASLDPDLKQRGIQGASNASKLDREIWNEFFQRSDELFYESEVLRARLVGGIPLPAEAEPEFGIGKEREAVVKARVNQGLFRAAVLASYQGCCALSGISQARLLVASHIVPWRMDAAVRLDPRNGICLNGLYDKAFDAGLFTIGEDYEVILSKAIKEDKSTAAHFAHLEGRQMEIPDRFKPRQDLLAIHRAQIFLQG